MNTENFRNSATARPESRGRTDNSPAGNSYHALVVEGGAMRCIYSAGVLDAFIRAGYYPFTAAYGVSAGASNIAAYLARMEGRNYKVYTDYMRRREFIRPFRFFTGGHYMDLDWLWDITKAEIPLDEESILSSGVDHKVLVTRTDTGEAEYIKPEKLDLVELLKASSAIPIFYRSYPSIRGVPYSDGGIADPIPAEMAWREGRAGVEGLALNEKGASPSKGSSPNKGAASGADASSSAGADASAGARRVTVTVLRSRPFNYTMGHKNPGPLARWILRDRPALFKALSQRPQIYNRQISFLRNPPAGCEIRELNPPENIGLGRLTTDKEILDSAYRAGVEAGKSYMADYPLQHATA